MARGGLRYGAGRKATRGKVEATPRIDIRAWARAGMLVPGASGVWGWPGGAGVAWITEPAALRLGTIGASGQPVRQCITLARVACHLGGFRPLFACPDCGRRAAILYLCNAGMACRACKRLTYQSQCDGSTTKKWRRMGLLADRTPREGARLA